MEEAMKIHRSSVDSIFTESDLQNSLSSPKLVVSVNKRQVKAFEKYFSSPNHSLSDSDEEDNSLQTETEDEEIFEQKQEVQTGLEISVMSHVTS
jgi:hypothetical protein